MKKDAILLFVGGAIVWGLALYGARQLYVQYAKDAVRQAMEWLDRAPLEELLLIGAWLSCSMLVYYGMKWMVAKWRQTG